MRSIRPRRGNPRWGAALNEDPSKGIWYSVQGECAYGQVKAFAKDSPRKVGHLNYEVDGDRLEIEHIHVVNECRKQGVATGLYETLCERVLRECPHIQEVHGSIVSGAALKARNKIFGEPKKLILVDNKTGVEMRMTSAQALKQMKMCPIPRNLGEALGSGNYAETTHGVKRCKRAAVANHTG